jgi:hypothetical protein
MKKYTVMKSSWVCGIPMELRFSLDLMPYYLRSTTLMSCLRFSFNKKGSSSFGPENVAAGLSLLKY